MRLLSNDTASTSFRIGVIRAIQEIVDMPDRRIDLFIRFCLQNNGRLSALKRSRYFEFLAEDEIAQMEQAIQSAYGDNTLKNV